MRKLIIVSVFILLTPLTLIITFLALTLGLTHKTVGNIPFLRASANYELFKSLPWSIQNETTLNNAKSHDARMALVRKFLTKYNSPLAEHSEFIVATADKYHIDYRLIPSISMQESTGCKFIPDDSYNCWGYGIYGNKVLRFENYQEGIETVSKGLRKNYYDHGLDTPIEIMKKYTPPSLALGGPWASGVYYFFEEIEAP